MGNGNKTPTSVRLDDDLKVELEKIAKREKRSLNNLINIALAYYVRQYNNRKNNGTNNQ